MNRAKCLKNRDNLRLKRKKRIRSKISGTCEAPRLTIFKSNKYLYAQAIDDINGNTLASINSKKLNLKVNKENAIQIGKQMSEELKNKKISKVVFDKNGYLYHGVVASFATSLRDNGIKL